LLQLDFVTIGQRWVRVDLLLQDAEVVSHHHDLVEETLERHFLRSGRSGRPDASQSSPDATARPSCSITAESGFSIPSFSTTASAISENNEAKGSLEARDTHLRVRRFDAAGFGRDGAPAGIKLHVRQIVR
jgi:hypothetical protein